MMLTTPEEPYVCVPKLHCKDSKASSLLLGHFRMISNIITVVVKKRKERENNYYSRYRRGRFQQQAEPERTFHLVSIRTAFIDSC